MLFCQVAAICHGIPGGGGFPGDSELPWSSPVVTQPTARAARVSRPAAPAAVHLTLNHACGTVAIVRTPFLLPCSPAARALLSGRWGQQAPLPLPAAGHPGRS